MNETTQPEATNEQKQKAQAAVEAILGIRPTMEATKTRGGCYASLELIELKTETGHDADFVGHVTGRPYYLDADEGGGNGECDIEDLDFHGDLNLWDGNVKVLTLSLDRDQLQELLTVDSYYNLEEAATRKLLGND